MTPRDDLRELLPLYVLGLLDPDEAAQVERAVRDEPSLAAELASYDAAASRLIDGLVPVAPPPAVRDRLLASTAPAPGRFERFAARMGEIFDLATDRARDLFQLIDDPSTYDPSIRNAYLIHFQAGPALAGADCGFIILPAGATFPWHRHDGGELTLVLQGTLLDADGSVLGPGEEDLRPPGSEHQFTAGPGDDLIFCARVWGLRFDVERPPET